MRRTRIGVLRSTIDKLGEKISNVLELFGGVFF